MDENIMNHSVGMGLGLSICNTLMRAQKAELKLQNTSDGVIVSFKYKS
jgi:K+-sensing histidine kinase KdpD